MEKKLIKILTLLLEDYPKEPSKLHWVKFFRSETVRITPKDDQTIIVKNPLYGVLGRDLLEVKRSCDEFIDSNDLLTPTQLVKKLGIITMERLIKAYDSNRINPTNNYSIRVRNKDNSWYEPYTRPELKDKSVKEITQYFKKMIGDFNKNRGFEPTRRLAAVKRHVYKFHNYYLKETQIVLK